MRLFRSQNHKKAGGTGVLTCAGAGIAAIGGQCPSYFSVFGFLLCPGFPDLNKENSFGNGECPLKINK